MNRIYRLVWSRARHAWVAAAENARGHGGGSLTIRLAAGIAAAVTVAGAQAADAGSATVVGGSGMVSQQGLVTTITQSSQRMAIDWSALSTAANESVRFVQPNGQAIAMNRVTGASPSVLLGKLSANGQVFILNPNGVLFGGSAQVDVGGLVAATLTMDKDAFLNGSATLVAPSGGSHAGVVNQGHLHAAEGGYVALLGATVRNDGVIDAPLGGALLAAGDRITLTLDGGKLINYRIDQGSLDALVENHQLIRADGGQVLLTAAALNALGRAVVNNTGVIEAHTVQNHNGHIVLLGDMQAGTVNVGGTLDASAPAGGNGGFIETSAAHVKVADNAVVTTRAAQGLTGSWLIDPVDFTVAASGGDMTGAAVSAALNGSNFEILSTTGSLSGSGDININDVIAWSASTTLTLSAQRNININQRIAASSGRVALQYGLNAVSAGNTATANVRAPVDLPAGGNFSTRLGSDGVTVQFQVISSINAVMGIAYGGRYALGRDIDASGVAYDNVNYGFTGILDGLGHVLSNLNISSYSSAGLFRETAAGSVIRNIGLVNASLHSSEFAASGGLVGISRSTISNSYVTGQVNGVSNLGGLVGLNYGTISNSYAMVDITGSSDLAGVLVGINGRGGVISNSYAVGSISGPGRGSGGLTAENEGSIVNSYANVSLLNGASGGGLVGGNSGSISHSFWNSSRTGLNNSGVVGATGINDAAAMQLVTFKNAGWSIDDTGGTSSIWRIYDNQTGPLLRFFLKPITVTGNAAGRTYDGTTHTDATYSGTSVPGAVLSGDLVYVTSKNAGTYSITDGTLIATGLYSDQQGYDISYVGASATIGRASVTLSSSDVTKSYDGTTVAAGTAVATSGVIFAGDSASGGNFSFTDKNAGTGNKTVTVGDITINDGNGGNNYNVSYVDNTTSTINRANVSLSTSDVTKTYDGTISASGTVVAVAGSVFSGDSVSGGSFAYTDKNAGTGNKTVTVGGITINDGNGGNNYNVTYVNNTTSTINQADLTISTTDVSKTYDGTTAAAGSVIVSAGTVFAGDSVSGGSFAFTDKNAGNGDKHVTTSGVTVGDGVNNGNYRISYVDNTTSTINRANVSLSSADVTKTYDGTTSAAGTVIVVGGTVFTGDSIGGGNFAFTDKNAGTGNKTVTVGGITINDGNGGGNYNVTYVDNTTSTINRANVSLSTSDVTKTYDGTTSASGSVVAVAGTIFSGDGISGGSFAYTDKNAGTGNKTVTVGGATINDGNGGNNYNVTYVDNTTSTINKADLTVSSTDVSKTYDGTTAAAGSVIVTAGTVFNGDSISGGSFAFTDKNAGTGNKTVTVGGITINDGNGGGNYNVTYADNTTSTINRANVSLSTSDVTKTYDGSTSASGTVIAVAGTVFSGDNISGGSFAYTDKNAGTGNKTVTVGGITINDGNGGNNYNVTYVDNTTSTIDRASLVVTATGIDKVYDGTTGALVSLNYAPLAGDNVHVSGTASFSDSSVGNDKAVMIGQLTLSGADAGNYQLAALPTGVTADITAPATVSAPPAVPVVPDVPVDPHVVLLQAQGVRSVAALDGAALTPDNDDRQPGQSARQLRFGTGAQWRNPMAADVVAASASSGGTAITPRLREVACGVRLPDGGTCR